MSAEKLNAQKVDILRSTGHEEAADMLAEMFAEDAGREQETRRKQLPGIPLVSRDPAQTQADVESRTVLEHLNQSGVGRNWGSAGPLLDDRRRADR